MNEFKNFFMFEKMPFGKAPDVGFFFYTKKHREVLSSLSYLLDSNDEFALLLGAPGTGKTLTIRKFIAENEHRMIYSYILFHSMSARELLMAILDSFGVKYRPDAPSNTLYRSLKQFFMLAKKMGKKTVLIVDEAQNLPDEALEELRIISNLETEDTKLLKIVLAGHPELKRRIDRSSMKQLKDRISISSHLRNMNYGEVRNYITNRISRSTRMGIKVESGVFGAVMKHSSGNPRLVNVIMERSVLAAFAGNSYSIRKIHVVNALNSLSIPNKVVGFSYYARVTTYSALCLAFLAIASLGAYHSYRYGLDNSEFDTFAVSTLHIREQQKSLQVQAMQNRMYGVVRPADVANGQEETLSDLATINVVPPNTVEKAKPAPAVVEKPQKIMGSVSTKMLNVRSGPGADYDRVYILYGGETVEVVKEVGSWANVILDNDRKAWVRKEYLRIEK